MSITVELDEKLVEKIDEISVNLAINRKRFVEDALQEALLKAQKTLKIKEKERQAVESYRKHPIQPNEFYIDEEQLIEAWKDL